MAGQKHPAGKHFMGQSCQIDDNLGMPTPHRVIALQPERPASPLAQALPVLDGAVPNTPNHVTDRWQRPLHDLRISVTDRCNFRCTYCMPRQVFGPDHAFLQHSALLSFEEIERLCRLMLPLGVRKLRLTGGEPLMRKQLDRLVAALAPLQSSKGQPIDLAMTTNGVLLPKHAQALKRAGLQRLSISMDALDDATFKRMSDTSLSVREVLAGIESAQHAGFADIKVNMVVQRGVNDHQIVPMAKHFRHSGIELRFIEFMDVGNTNGWQHADVVSAQHIQDTLHAHFPLQPLPARNPHETAKRFGYADGAGSVGFIASVTQAFCGNCNRLRLSTDGQLFTCLFASQGSDVKTALRNGSSDKALQAQLARLWSQRSDRYSEQRGQTAAAASALPASRIEMSYIGG